MNVRLIIALLTSLLDEALIVAAIVWGLPQLGIEVPLYVTILVMLAFALYAVATFRFGSRALSRKQVPGFSSMVDMQGVTVTPLNPRGLVKIESELWTARAVRGTITQGVRVVVIQQEGLKLIVQPRIKA